jgi:hypothetical protein
MGFFGSTLKPAPPYLVGGGVPLRRVHPVHDAPRAGPSPYYFSQLNFSIFELSSGPSQVVSRTNSLH